MFLTYKSIVISIECGSTFSWNMPMRGFLYFADLYRKILPLRKLYGKKRVWIPAPKYIVFYNGPVKDMTEDKMEIKLSDAFMQPVEKGMMIDFLKEYEKLRMQLAL